MPINKEPYQDSVQKMKGRKEPDRKRVKPKTDIGPGNPLKRLRYAMRPTEEEKANRHWRDRRKKFLLQRELAARIPCSESCVRVSEKNQRLPIQSAVFQNSYELYLKYFPLGDKSLIKPFAQTSATRLWNKKRSS